MTEIVAYCGLICRTCPICVATRQENKEEQVKMRTEIVRLCHEHYGMNYTIEDITDCDGCRAESGRLFLPSNKCQIRKCAKEKGVKNCARCSDYACERLDAVFKTDPAAKRRLDEIKIEYGKSSSSV
jgi:hypothetical protein